MEENPYKAPAPLYRMPRIERTRQRTLPRERLALGAFSLAGAAATWPLALNVRLPVEGQEWQLPWVAAGALVGFLVGVFAVLEWRR